MTWSSYYDLVDQLQGAQRDYVAANSTSCSSDYDADLLARAESSIQFSAQLNNIIGTNPVEQIARQQYQDYRANGGDLFLSFEEWVALGMPQAGLLPNTPNGTYPVVTQPNTAFFWSGKTDGVGGEEVAREIATDYGGTTLEGLIESRNIHMPAWDPTNPEVVSAWKAISAEYAAGASGTVRAVIGENLRPDNVWETAELPALMNNQNVDKIIVIDPVTRVESVIFSRSRP